jgi:hypothetical protein
MIRFISIQYVLQIQNKVTYVTNTILSDCNGLGDTSRITASEVDVFGASLLFLCGRIFFYFVDRGRTIAGDVHRIELSSNVCDIG